jgi:hypothetical protein
VFDDVPRRAGYLEATGGGGWAQDSGVFGRLEAGARPADNLALFGFGEWSSRSGGMAGVGARLTFGL